MMINFLRLRNLGQSLGAAVLALGLILAGGAAQAEKTFRFVMFGDISTLDPLKGTTVTEARLFGDLFLPLTTVAADGTTIPGAAESWTISPDGLVYTFRLRPHTWSDGVAVTAEDFVFAFRRFLDPATAAPNALDMFLLKNGEAFLKGEVSAEDVGVRALNNHTLEVTLEAPTPYFLDQLSHMNTVPLPRHVIAARGKDWLKPKGYVGNGPYLLESYTVNDKIVLVKNPKFYDADSVKIDRALYTISEDQGEHLKRFRAGDVDATDIVPTDQLEWLQKNMPEELRVFPIYGLHSYLFNLRQPPFDDGRVRRALSMVIDRDILSYKVMKTGEIPAYNYVPPDENSYGTLAEVEWKNWPMEKRIAEAKSLMAEAGYGPGNPLKFTLIYNTSEGHKRRAIAIAAMWKQTLGVEASLFNVEGKVLFAELAAHNFEVGRYGGIGPLIDPSTFTASLETRSVGRNHTGYSNPEYDDLVFKASRTVDAQERFNLFRQAEAIALRDHPMIPLAYYVSTRMVSKKITGWEDNIKDIHPLRWLDISE